MRPACHKGRSRRLDRTWHRGSYPRGRKRPYPFSAGQRVFFHLQRI